ncbi:hypothetical protein SO3561_00119 [Streptomyces olivochromogenes]|uniref:Uncharacterized protein n=1 Tax=Streptomyces olivochromogenes TaxID=1963 RepID=A0A250V3F3_STROL|nr:hypothetical protein SO3561_00119 [Streptomyces olivochromogenes]
MRFWNENANPPITVRDRAGAGAALPQHGAVAVKP